MPAAVVLNCDSGTVTAPTLPPATPEHAAEQPRRASLAARLRGAGRSTAGRFARLRRGSPAREPWLNGVLGALWAAVIGLGLAALPMLVMWMSSPQSGLTWTDSLRLSGLLWVVAHGVPVTIAGVTLTLVPWGLVVIPVLLLAMQEAGPRGAATSTPCARPRSCPWQGPAAYAVIAGVLAMLTTRPTASVGLPVAVGCAFVVALLSLGFGSLRASGVPSPPFLPPLVLVVARAGVVGAITLVGLGAVAATASLMRAHR